MATTPPKSPPPPPKRSRFRISPLWAVLAVVLLALNFWIGQRATESPSRVRVSYTPFFLDQVTGDRVKDITSKGTAIQGNFTGELSYQGSAPTDSLPDRDPGLRRHRSAVAAAAGARGGRECGAARHRAALVGEPAGGIRADAALHRAAGPAVPPGRQRPERAWQFRPLARPPLSAGARNGSRSRTWRASRRPSRNWRRWSTSFAARTSTDGWAAASRTACCWPDPRHRQDTAGASGGR